MPPVAVAAAGLYVACMKIGVEDEGMTVDCRMGLEAPGTFAGVGTGYPRGLKVEQSR